MLKLAVRLLCVEWMDVNDLLCLARMIGLVAETAKLFLNAKLKYSQMCAIQTSRPHLVRPNEGGQAQSKVAVSLVQSACKAAKPRTPKFSRAALVGKFPEIRHQPAPEARCLLSEEIRDAIVSRMKLV